jgi:cytochrome c-type biogenesis protein CcmH
MILRAFGIFLLLTMNAFALQDYYAFQNIAEQKRFEQLTTELRCLVCQNQNLAESNATLAVDLRNQIYTKVREGHQNQEIIDYLVERYGDFILYRPPLNSMTLALWFGPVLLLGCSILYLFYYIRKKRV